MASMQQARRARRLRRLAVVVGLLLAATLSLGWLLVSSMVRSSPTWWRQVTPNDVQTQRIAQEVENAVGTHIHLGREGGVEEDGIWRSEPWSVSIPASDANAWLNARLPRWIESLEPGASVPPGVREVQVEFSDGIISVGIGYAPPAANATSDAEPVRPKVLWATLGAQINDQGALVIKLERAYIGRLPLPISLLSSELFGLSNPLEQIAPPQPHSPQDDEPLPGNTPPSPSDNPVGSLNLQSPDAEEPGKSDTPNATNGPSVRQQIVNAVLNGLPLQGAPILRLDDGRRVRLTGIRARAGRLEITCVTEHGK